MPFPPVPASVKGIAHFLKAADEHEERNIVIAYWCRMYACTVAMKIVPGKKPPDVSALLIALMDWLEATKKNHSDLDGITNETAAQAIIEEYAIKLFNYADAQDRAENFNKNMVKAFYTAGILMDVLQQFGDLSEDIFSKRKYAKWKAAYIHNCLKFGDTPVPGPPRDDDDDNLVHKSELDDGSAHGNITQTPTQPTTPPDTTQTSRPTFPDQSTSQMPFNPPPVTPTIQPTPPTPPIQPTQPPQPPQPIQPIAPLLPTPSGSAEVTLSPLQIEKAQKYCKWAASALNYDDVKTAIGNLQKALNLLQYGKDEN